MPVCVMVDRDADRPLYKQLADVIRAQIEHGELAPGDRVPGETTFMQELNLSRHSVRNALAISRNEGLIVTSPRGSFVRACVVHMIVQINSGMIFVRMPTARERRKLGIGEGVPIFVIERDGVDAEIHPGNRIGIRVGPD